MAKNKRSIWFKLGITVLVLLATVLIAGFGSFYIMYNKVNTIEIDKENLSITSDEELSQFDNHTKIKNIALFGIDSVDGVGRSDSIMIATIDSVHNKLKVTSFMRDSYVNIEGYGYDKLTHAYAFGGPELSIKTINKAFGLNIQDFVAVDFSSLPKIIDILGGIELNITPEEIEYVNSYIDNINKLDGTNSPHIVNAGVQQVDGVQALAYTRVRYTSGGDYERTQRHRTVLNILFQKALTLSATEYPSIINNVLPYLSTNLKSTDILSLCTKVVTMGSGKLEQERFPRDGYCQGETINGVYYLTFDETTTKEQVMNYIFDDK